MIQEALAASAEADVIVAALGEVLKCLLRVLPEEYRFTRSTKQIIKALVATGKPVALVLFTGRPLTLAWEDANVPAILNVWFAGSEAGDAIGMYY
jgi:beta-glucosidase